MTTNIVTVDENRIISAETNYQGFEYDFNSKVCIPTGNRTPFKWKTLESVFDIVTNKSFMDLGANFGFFCFKALEYNCSNSIGVEANINYYNPIKEAIDCKNILGIQWVLGKFPLITEKLNLRADIVMALSLIHHLFTKYSLSEILSSLYNITNEYLIIEWIDINDGSIKKYDYVKDHPEYSRKNFDDVCSIFREKAFVGNGHHPTRFIYLLKK